MTTVYGVTFVGARNQIEKQLKDLKGIPEEECWGAASYLARLVYFIALTARLASRAEMLFSDTRVHRRPV
jgi:DNA-directed RNA polymerase